MWEFVRAVLGWPFRLLFAAWRWLRQSSRIEQLSDERDELREKVEQLTEPERVRAKLHRIGNAYWRVGCRIRRGTAYCVGCVDTDGKTITLTELGDGVGTCPRCKSKYPDAFPEK